MSNRNRYLLVILGLLLCRSSVALDSQANNLLSLIGKDRNSIELKTWKAIMTLDRQFANSEKGVRLALNEFTGQVESVILSRGTQGFTDLPFGIGWNEDTTALVRKLGPGEKIVGRNGYKYSQQNFAIEVISASNQSWEIQSIRFYQEEANIAPEKRALAVREEMMKKSREVEGKNPSAPAGTERPEIKMAKVETRLTDFKKSILSVFRSYKESAFAAIKKDSRTSKNFWNYKYTYATDLKIPGEKYNMLYSFPFSSSQLDFVSVLKESDELDPTFIKTYHDFEKQLMENFPSKEGWVASCIANHESKTLSDLEFRNDDYGSVVLDYCKSPKGKHVLYMRFLLFSN